MAPSKAINIELKAQQQAILQRQLESGYYDNPSEVIGDALRALDQRETAYEDFLRAKVKASLANKRPSVPIDEAFARARRAVARKGKAAKRGA
jgi:antitoxin ParD1/3/4